MLDNIIYYPLANVFNLLGTTEKYRIKCELHRPLVQIIAKDLLLKLRSVDMSCSWVMPSVEDYVVWPFP
mgnify:CR=1 FL=1